MRAEMCWKKEASERKTNSRCCMQDAYTNNYDGMESKNYTNSNAKQGSRGIIVHIERGRGPKLNGSASAFSCYIDPISWAYAIVDSLRRR